MAKLVSLANLLADVRALYEVRDITISDTVLTRWINRSLALLWDHIISVAPDHYLSSADLSIVAGTDSYSFEVGLASPATLSTFYKGHGLDVLLEDGTYCPLRTFEWEERHLYANASVQRADTRYRYMGAKLYLAPKPTWSGTVKVWFIPVATTLTASPANEVDLMNSWEEFIICDVAIKCAIKEESSTTALEKRRETILRDIKSFAPQRDFSHNDKVRDVNLQYQASANPFARLPRPS